MHTTKKPSCIPYRSHKIALTLPWILSLQQQRNFLRNPPPPFFMSAPAVLMCTMHQLCTVKEQSVGKQAEAVTKRTKVRENWLKVSYVSVWPAREWFMKWEQKWPFKTNLMVQLHFNDGIFLLWKPQRQDYPHTHSVSFFINPSVNSITEIDCRFRC